jgi:hypothetical protein
LRDTGPGETLDYAHLVEERGYETPEEAVLAERDIPAQYATVVGSRIRGDEAHVWLMTNDRLPFEEYECVCVRAAGLWYETHGWGGFSVGTPREIRKRAREIRSASA